MSHVDILKIKKVHNCCNNSYQISKKKEFRFSFQKKNEKEIIDQL